MAGNPWAYKPSPAAAMIFLILFTLATLWHVVIVFRRKVWYFTVLIIGGVLGYTTRFLGARNTDSITFFIVQTLCILVASALFAASIYMVLGRMVILVNGEDYSPIKPSRLTMIFVGGDIVNLIIQIMGSGLLSSNFNLRKTIILVGLAAQLVIFGLFVGVASVFHRRLARNPTQQSEILDGRDRKKGWRGVMLVIYLAGAMIFVRSMFRFIEFVGDHDSPMQKSEAYLYVCDSTLMLGVLAILIYYHPSEYVPSGGKAKHIRAGEELM